MNKEEILEKIFDALMENGTVSEKADILGIDPMEDKVYTKRIKVDKTIGHVKVVYVTITSDDEDFADASVSNMRVNTKNAYDSWVNFFATQADESILSRIYETIRAFECKIDKKIMS
jgi:hypothetical protein